MAMTMSGEIQLAASREIVWAKLNDPAVLKLRIPGCEELERIDDQGFRAVAKMRLGPISARFKSRVTLTDLDPPRSYNIVGEGEGGVAGFAKGGARVKLLEQDDGTLLTYQVDAQIGGKLAILGQRLVNGTAKKLADESSPISGERFSCRLAVCCNMGRAADLSARLPLIGREASGRQCQQLTSRIIALMRFRIIKRIGLAISD